MACPDFFAIKERIVAILKADTTNLWDSTPGDRTTLRKIEAGAPTPKAMEEPPLPRCWVTSDNNVAQVKIITDVQSNDSAGSEYEINLKIIVVNEAKDGVKTEEDLDDFTKAIIEQLQGNYDLRTPGGLESTRLADSSRVMAVRTIPKTVGDAVAGREIQFKVISTA
jgi:hypothetical protein